ncbi:MAG: tRNA-dihydrouridine synthase family protein [Clostridia bacterium]|nr:tRNA-dihydrouridine synthase family protein [Clostridia bacterium]
MKLYFAPLEGITDGLYRRAHCQMFNGVDKYFAPFISPSAGFRVTHREKRQLLSDRDANYTVVPQLLIGKPDALEEILPRLADAGFSEINLNLGCPSGTVTAKGKGAGLLREPDALRTLLDALFALPCGLAVSAKTRIGFSDASEWEGLWQILRAYPFSELIVHARTREEYYRGRTHPDALALCCGAPFPVIFTGDLFSPEDVQGIEKAYPELGGVMLGRGLVANPALSRMLRGGEALTISELKRFHDALCDAYAEEMPFKALHGRMCEIMSYVCCCLDSAKKPLKQLRKAQTLADYRSRTEALFAICDLKQQPWFDPLNL